MYEASEPAALLKALIHKIAAEATACHLDGSFVEACGTLVNAEDASAPSAEELVRRAFSPDDRQLLDFGCGAAHHRPFLTNLGYEWHGIDRLDTVSPLVSEAVAALGDQITTYDGRRMPFPDDSFDIVYSMLVFHHLPDIGLAFSEIARVMRPGAKLIGQVSCMEQVQDYSTFNFTPYGLVVASRAAGLTVKRLYPKHDAFSFLFRRLMITLGASDDNGFNILMNPTGYFHEVMIETGQRLGLSVRDINLLRLKFCSQFVFEIEK